MKLRAVLGLTSAFALAAVLLPNEEQQNTYKQEKPQQKTQTDKKPEQSTTETIVAKAFKQAKEACADISDPTANRECEAQAIQTHANIELVKQCAASPDCDTKQLSETLSRQP